LGSGVGLEDVPRNVLVSWNDKAPDRARSAGFGQLGGTLDGNAAPGSELKIEVFQNSPRAAYSVCAAQLFSLVLVE
jgi:hypothetical protein